MQHLTHRRHRQQQHGSITYCTELLSDLLSKIKARNNGPAGDDGPLPAAGAGAPAAVLTACTNAFGPFNSPLPVDVPPLIN